MPHPTLAKMARSREKLLALVTGLSETQLDLHLGDGWSIRQTLTHLLNAEEDHVGVIHRFVNNEQHLLPAQLDLDSYNARRLNQRGYLTLAQLLEGLANQRGKTEAFFNSLNEEQLAIRGRHPGLGDMTAEGIFRILGIHDQMHTRDIEAILAASI